MSTTDLAHTTCVPDPVRPIGVVPTTGRGRLPGAPLNGEPLVAHAARALAAAGVEVVAADVPWADLVGRAAPLVVHDPLCPLTPSGFLARAVDVASTTGVVVVATRPVTDTIKAVEGEVVGETVDRDLLVTVTSPVILPASVVSALDGAPDLANLAAFVTRLRATFATTLIEAPALGRRVEDDTDVLLLQAFAELHPPPLSSPGRGSPGAAPRA